jgi:hypothetical protein
MFCGQLTVNCLCVKSLCLKTKRILVMFRNSCPWNRHTLAWRGESYRLRIRRVTTVNTCVQAVTHAALFVQAVAYFKCNSFLCNFDTCISYLKEDVLRLKLLEDIPLSRVQITHPYCQLLTTGYHIPT